MEEIILKKEDKIFQNLYNEFGWKLKTLSKEMIGKILKI